MISLKQLLQVVIIMITIYRKFGTGACWFRVGIIWNPHRSCHLHFTGGGGASEVFVKGGIQTGASGVSSNLGIPK